MAKIIFMTLMLTVFVSSANATLKTDKVTLKGNMQVKYNKLPSPINSIEKAFLDGLLYARIRTNTFYWDWDKEIAGEQKDNRGMGIGASLIYKTAPLNGLSATLGLYTSQNPIFNMDKDQIGFSKASKDTFSRSKIKNGTSYDGSYGMTVLGQGYLQYDLSKTTIKLGRQMFESVLTSSNDTKMIPNTFDGVTAEVKDISDTKIKLAYLVKQKLRDHTTSHDVIASDGWEENDDSAANQNLTKELIGTHNELLVVSVDNKFIKNLKTNISYTTVPDVLGNLNLEAHYTFALDRGWKIAPGIRYMKQYDYLNTGQNVASLKSDAMVGYDDKTDLDSGLVALRLDLKNEAFLGRLGYSKIEDKADMIAPWRGFPTGGFTRAMAQYNWFANTKTYMLRLGYDFGKTDVIPGFSIMGRYCIQDFDDSKDGVQADTDVIHVDMRQNIGKNLEMKIRLAFAEADDDIVMSNGIDTKIDVSYNEYRLEFNYFF